MFYLYEIRDTDGNDCTVYDCVIEAKDKDTANEVIGAHFDQLAKDKKWESDDSFGYFYPCECEQPDEPTDDPSACDQCEVISINGVGCHETSCPTFAKYKRDLKRFNQFECQGHGGLTVDEYNATEHATEEDAREHMARFHGEYVIDQPEVLVNK